MRNICVRENIKTNNDNIVKEDLSAGRAAGLCISIIASPEAIPCGLLVEPRASSSPSCLQWDDHTSTRGDSLVFSSSLIEGSFRTVAASSFASASPLSTPATGAAAASFA